MTKMIYRSAEALDYPKDVTLTELLLNYNLNNTPAEKPAIIDGISGQVVFTYASFRSAVRKIARHLRDEVGIEPGDVVGILSTNRVSHLHHSLAEKIPYLHAVPIELLSRLRARHPCDRRCGISIEPSLRA
jgi:acyl-CoA synthetase (AMP-forming)/AMP-acid ligase II